MNTPMTDAFRAHSDELEQEIWDIGLYPGTREDLHRMMQSMAFWFFRTERQQA